ncbi:MAG: DUF4402 domain-containing protein [Mariniphaga sp.]|nr:DUF4402 domain-containing protein [Mariniphaga sp.]
MNSQIQYTLSGRLLMPFFIFITILLFNISTSAQEQPPRPITVTVSTAQHLSFGTFIQSGAFGTVSVTVNSIRSATGSIILPGMTSTITPALFLVDAEPGTLITIVKGTDTILTGSNGGTLILKIDESNPASPFIISKATGTTDVFIGGTLTVGPLGANPPGFYNGTFVITFVQQ